MARGYIAGGMTGIHLFNWPAFEAEARLRRATGWDIVTPTEIDEDTGMVAVERLADGTIISVETTDTFDYEAILKIDLEQVATCDAIILLPGWQRSSGAKRELAHALSLDLAVYVA